MWQAVWAKNTVKALLPLKGPLRSAKRRLSPPRIGPQHESVLKGGRDHIAALRSAGADPRGRRILELGTGWFPLIPIVLRIAGAERVYLTDAFRLMDGATLAGALDHIAENGERVADLAGVPYADAMAVIDAVRSAETLDTMMEALRFTYLAPFDAAGGMPEIDAVVSHTVLEHIPPEVLRTLMTALATGLPEGGVMSHGIDNTDHRANDDPALDRLDFLRYGDRQWALLCLDPQSYTNRLRHSDYLALFRDTGHEIVSERTFVVEESLGPIAQLRLPPRFAGKDMADLATGWSHIVTRRTGLQR